MIKKWIITLLLCLLIVAGGIFVIHTPRTVPFDQCSETYKTYCNRPGINATFIKDLRINDTVTVDVTLLEAVDSAGWETLRKDFNVPVLDSTALNLLAGKEYQTFTRLISKTDPTRMDSIQNDVLATQPFVHKLTVFHIKDGAEKHALLHLQWDKNLLTILIQKLCLKK